MASLIGSTSLAHSGALMLAYRDFGTQAMAHELIGSEWWQWDSHGDSDPEVKYPIRVVVYWEQTLDETKIAYPVYKRARQDFRYVKRSQATAYLEKAQKELAGEHFSWAEELRNGLKKTLELLKDTHSPSWGLPTEVKIESSGIEMPVFFPSRAALEKAKEPTKEPEGDEQSVPPKSDRAGG